jgi:hypothetical protein
MNFFDFLESLGIKMPLIISGAAGGLASIKINSKISWFGRFLAIVGGSFSANYLTPVVVNLMNLSDKTVLGMSFLVGYGGLAFIEILYKRVTKLSPNNIEVVDEQIEKNEIK